MTRSGRNTWEAESNDADDETYCAHASAQQAADNVLRWLELEIVAYGALAKHLAAKR